MQLKMPTEPTGRGKRESDPRDTVTVVEDWLKTDYISTLHILWKDTMQLNCKINNVHNYLQNPYVESLSILQKSNPQGKRSTDLAT